MAGGFPSLSTEQWNSLLNIINNQSNSEKLSGKRVGEWILDSGCSHYMIGKRDLKNIIHATSYTEWDECCDLIARVCGLKFELDYS